MADTGQQAARGGIRGSRRAGNRERQHGRAAARQTAQGAQAAPRYPA
jgi:hypothetical protein